MALLGGSPSGRSRERAVTQLIAAILFLLLPPWAQADRCLARIAEDFAGQQAWGESKSWVVHLSGEGDFEITGSRKVVELGPDYQLTLIREDSGRIHVFDESDFPVGRVGPKKRSEKFQSKEALALFDREKFLKFACAQRSRFVKDPRYQRLARYVKDVDRNFLSRFENASKAFALRCITGQAAGLIPVAILGLARTEAEKNGPSFYSDHVSNFAIGLVGMNAMHQCLSGLAPALQRQILAATLGTNAAANIFFEVEMGQSDPITGKRVQTDVIDLASGALGILTYYAVANYLEGLFGPFARYCR